MVKKFQWYPSEDVQQTPKWRKPKASKLRKSITPGTVLILLAGRFRGKRVVFLKQLKSGLLAVTGPFKLNGVPVKRVQQTYTLSTSTKVDLKGVKLDGITDETFDARKTLQKSVDTAILANIKDKIVKKYIGARFSLVKHDAPHAMKF